MRRAAEGGPPFGCNITASPGREGVALVLVRLILVGGGGLTLRLGTTGSGEVSRMTNEYDVRLRGVASASLIEALCRELEIQADTVLYGEFQDQAAFHGLLERIRDIGLEIVDVRQVSHWPDQPPAAPGPSSSG